MSLIDGLRRKFRYKTFFGLSCDPGSFVNIKGRISMKLLAVADLHYSLKQFDWVSAVSGKFDLVVVAGDLLDQASAVDVDTQILVVLKYLRRWRSNAPLVVGSGNHDLNARNEFNEFAAIWLSKARKLGVVVDGDDHFSDGILFSICPWWDGVESWKSVV